MFEEEKHPRDNDGKFTDNNGAKKGYDSKDDLGNIRNAVEQEKGNHLSRLLGQEYKGYKGQSAVDKLLQEKQGHIKGAFHRDDIGDIDLLWGNDNVGLKHIINQREKEKEGHVDEIISHLTTAIEKGEYKKQNDRGNYEIIYKENNAEYHTIIAPEYHKNKITYVLTAFRRGKFSKNK